MMRIGLVACSKTKADQPAPARDLYQGTLFRRASAYAERMSDQWYILSAKHGLVLPTTILDPYDISLYDMSHEERHQWGEDILDALAEVLPGPCYRWLILAGKRYREHIEPYLGPIVETPLAGLGIGEQISWLSDENLKLSHRCAICEVAIPTHPGGLCSKCKSTVSKLRLRKYGYPV